MQETKLTKYGHACVFIEKNGRRVVIDPGEFTELPNDLHGIVAVVFTHEHADHVSAENLQKIVAVNPDVNVYANSETLEAVTDIDCNKFRVDKDMEIPVGGFALNLYANDHAIIWQKSPCKNVAVKVDDAYFYPGDSFKTIEQKVAVLGVPISAPWLKVGESLEFARTIDCEYVVPVHNGLYNDAGHDTSNNWFKIALDNTGKALTPLQNGESLVV